MNYKSPPLWLVVGLMMFPQIVETIYSPVLTHIASQFEVSEGQSSQTLSVYFLAFAVGVVFWGRVCDKIGRRPAMLCGLLTYALGSLLALLVNDFEFLLLARVVSAFGAAVGSVITQTMLRDSYQGLELAKVFSVMGIAISISPVIGLISGGQLSELFGYVGVFTFLMVIAIILLLVSSVYLPETRPATTVTVELFPLARRMFNDPTVLRTSILVSLFNTMLFGYYSLAPFLFSELGFSASEFGYSGIVLAIATLIGGLLNKKLLKNGFKPLTMVRISVLLSLLSGVAVLLTQDSLLFLVPMMGVVISFGMAIPNILSQALSSYRDVAGSAGALFGLSYYVLLSFGLAVAGAIQSIGVVLSLSGLACVIFTYGLDFKEGLTKR